MRDARSISRAIGAAIEPEPAEPEPKRQSLYPRPCGQIGMFRQFPSARWFLHLRVQTKDL
jgi:hypothetical protein